MNNAADGKRKSRSIMATDSEWTRIRERAEQDGIPISRYVVQQSLDTVERPAQESRLPLSVLLRLEELRFSQAGREDAWMPRLCRTEEGAAAPLKQYHLQAQRVGGDQGTGEGL